MATHAQAGPATHPSLPDVLPFDLEHLSRQSWELGSRVVDDAERVGEWRHVGGRWSLAAFDATTETLLLRLTSPVGRSHFYGAMRAEFRDARPALAAASEWEAVDDEA